MFYVQRAPITNWVGFMRLTWLIKAQCLWEYMFNYAIVPTVHSALQIAYFLWMNDLLY